MKRRTALTFVIAFVASVLLAMSLLLVPPVRVPVGRRPAASANFSAPMVNNRRVATSPTPAALEVPFQLNAAETLPTGQPDRLVITSIGLDAPVKSMGITIENGRPEWETAAFAVGYYRETALPGAGGNTVLAGHISSPVSHKGDVFRRLPDVHIGDVVDVYTGARRVRYAVAEIRVVPPTAIAVMAATPDPMLTLLTCYPDHVYSQRLVVIGRPVAEQS